MSQGEKKSLPHSHPSFLSVGRYQSGFAHPGGWCFNLMPVLGKFNRDYSDPTV